MSEIDAGIVSPNVPHYFYVYLPPDKYQAVVAGKPTCRSTSESLQGTRAWNATLLFRALCVRLSSEYFYGLGRRR